MSQIKEIKLKQENVDTVVMKDLQNQLVSDLMSKIRDVHNDWFEVFHKKMNRPAAAATMAIVTAACLVEVGNIQGKGMDECLGADSTIHYQVLLQMRNDVQRLMEEVRPLCPVADKIDKYREDNPAVVIG